jgi:hypothetical protein
LNLFPSVTEVLNVAAKPGLTNWLIQQAYLSALTLPHVEGETVDEFKRRAERDSKEQSEQAMKLGTEIHADIERRFLGQSPIAHKETAEAVYEFVVTHTGLSDGWIPESCFSSPFGYGGMVDLYHPDGWIIDYKTKDFGEDGINKSMAWDEHGMQLSAYAHGLGLPNARKMNIFASRNNPGLITHHEWNDDMFDRFKCLLEYWQLCRGYKPSTSPAEEEINNG